ncbi:TRP-domain-containing protein [Hyphopichia burtonii NRRL Y-1933]|uniref:TRP-domain-containing protein n=1 Tax=Hyphopichia burtonii NRRL Y-1933 TaxID=984485 RepID=A0A1E4RH35_9ASCO|nr:TRP-domain-containing protein [Hyphopichia burtonii NRRL Y-1933]ODV66425.1 TRP-domain-containing protein [Hyphopichia burtonii NRRL Y-1933]
MRLHFIWVFITLLLSQFTHAVNHIRSSSLLTCMDNSEFTASHFDVIYYPNNRTVYYDISAIVNIDTKVSASIELIAYGVTAFTKNISFCSLNYAAICPLSTGHLDLNSHYKLGKSVTSQIPNIAYTIPDLDARVRVVLYADDTYESLACVEGVLSNGKTVQTKYASWPIAAISGLGVITSGIVSVIGHSNTAAHIASNSMSLFIYFQSLAVTSMMAVAKVPPIAAAWAQNFVWSLGIIKAGFIQDIANWYLQSTGGSPTDVIGTSYLSVSVQKKKWKRNAMEFFNNLYTRQQQNNHLTIFKRASVSLDSDDFGYSDNLDNSLYTVNEKDSDLSSKILVLRGIQRVAYLAGIEITSLFMTGIIFLLFFAFIMVVCLVFFKAIIEICIRSKIMNEGKFNEYRQQWSYIIKGALYRLLLLALPQIALLCLWEFTRHDSVGIVVVAAFLFIVTIVLLFQAAIRVFLLGRKSVKQFKNPAYLLFGDGIFLNKFGFIYVQFRADCYYFVLISLCYIFAKSLFVAVLQTHGKVQGVIVFVIELAYCITVCVIRPFMDKRTNAFNITIAVINTINALFFMFFSYIFKEPHIVSSVMAIVYFVLNAVFALFLLLFTIITCVLALVYKNPDTRYQPMKDDRVSFLPRFDNPKTNAQANRNLKEGDDDLELMALGATAMRGHENGGKPNIYDDDDLYDDDSNKMSRTGGSGGNYKDEDSRDSNRDSYLDQMEPTQPSSTIVGNPSNAMRNYQSSYAGSSQYSNSSSSLVNPRPAAGGANNGSYYGYNRNQQQQGQRVNFI